MGIFSGELSLKRVAVGGGIAALLLTSIAVAGAGTYPEVHVKVQPTVMPLVDVGGKADTAGQDPNGKMDCNNDNAAKDSNFDPVLLRDHGISTIHMFAGQFPPQEFIDRAGGRQKHFANLICEIMGWSGLSKIEVQEALKSVDQPYTKEMINALELIQ
jgi:hypothetical protein